MIPEKLTAREVWDQAPAGETQLGHPLSRYGETFLQRALEGWAEQELLAQLEQVDGRCAIAWPLSRDGRPIEDIARALRCSRATAYRVLAAARTFMQPAESARPLTPGERLKRLASRDRVAHDVFLMWQRGWNRENAAAALDLMRPNPNRGPDDPEELPDLIKVNNLLMKAKRHMGVAAEADPDESTIGA